MVFVLVLCGLVIGVYLLLIALLLVAGFYGVFGAIVYGPFFIIRYIWRVFDGEDALEKSYDVRKPKKTKRVREPREVSNVRLTDRKPSRIKRIGGELRQSDKAGRLSKPREVSNVKLINNEPKNKVISGGAIRKVAVNKEPKRETEGIQTKQATRKAESKKATKGIQPKQATRKVKPQKANPRNSAPKKPNPRKVEPQGITPNIPTTSPLTDYPDMV